MRSYSTAFNTAVADHHRAAALLVQLDLDSGTQRYTTASSAVTAMSQTWLAAGGLVSIGPIRETGTQEVIGWEFGISGLSPAQTAIFLAEPVQGRRVRAWLALFDTDYSVIDSPGLVFDGLLDAPAREIDMNGKAVIAYAAESRHAIARRASNRRFTDADQQDRHPGDLWFQFVPQMVEKRIEFGKGA